METAIDVSTVDFIDAIAANQENTSDAIDASQENTSDAIDVNQENTSDANQETTIDVIDVNQENFIDTNQENFIDTSQENTIDTSQENTIAFSRENMFEVRLDDIMNSHNTLIEIEKENKIKFNSLDFVQFKLTLYKWASQGCPDSFIAYSFPIITPPTTDYLYNCSCGNPKNIWDYITYCMGSSIPEWISVYQSKVSGITLSFSVNTNPYFINIHVSRVIL
jgi:hypothetical protein